MDDMVIDGITISMKFKFKDEETTHRIYESLMLESKYDPNERAKTTIEIEDNILVVNIDAADSVSARAASNSFLKWINLSEQLLGYVDSVKES
ncbi:MAG: KEOPS complex subunit Pcc1 [Candidatus Heimdallarchaeaceae archaeon]